MLNSKQKVSDRLSSLRRGGEDSFISRQGLETATSSYLHSTNDENQSQNSNPYLRRTNDEEKKEEMVIGFRDLLRTTKDATRARHGDIIRGLTRNAKVS